MTHASDGLMPPLLSPPLCLSRGHWGNSPTLCTPAQTLPWFPCLADSQECAHTCVTELLFQGINITERCNKCWLRIRLISSKSRLLLLSVFVCAYTHTCIHTHTHTMSYCFTKMYSLFVYYLYYGMKILCEFGENFIGRYRYII